VADFQLFNAGANAVLDSGITGTVKFALSTKTAEELGPSAVAGAISEITGTGYAQISQTAPSAASQKKSFSAIEYKTETHTDWPSSVKSVVMLMGGVAICAWNLREGGGARDMSGAQTTEAFTATYSQS
jgi:hypothetical protein